MLRDGGAGRKARRSPPVNVIESPLVGSRRLYTLAGRRGWRGYSGMALGQPSVSAGVFPAGYHCLSPRPARGVSTLLVARCAGVGVGGAAGLGRYLPGARQGGGHGGREMAAPQAPPQGKWENCGAAGAAPGTNGKIAAPQAPPQGKMGGIAALQAPP
eukprot:gene18161-biopygen21927